MKKYLALILAAILTVTAIVGGTLAYFTDEDNSAHVYTVGNIKINQHEYERAANGSLQDFTQNKPAFPAFYGAAGLTAAPAPSVEYVWDNGYEGSSLLWADNITNVIDKFVFVENEGRNDAFFRTVVAYELPEGVSADKIIFNLNTTDYDWDLNAGETVITGDRYMMMVATNKEALGAKEMSAPSLLQVMFANNMTSEEGEAFGESFDVLVATQAVQFISDTLTIEETLVEAFGEVTAANNPWVEYDLVDSAKEFAKAVEEGGTVVLKNDIDLGNEPLVVKKGTDLTIDLNGNTLEGVSESDKSSYLIKVEADSTLTLTGDGVVSFYATTPDTEWGGVGQPAFPGYANNAISNVGNLVIDGALIENKTAPGGASYAIDCYQGSSLTVNSGIIDGCGKVAVRMFCNSATEKTAVTVNGGKLIGTRAIWVQLPGSNAAHVPPVEVTINGGVLETTGQVSGGEIYKNAIYSYSYGNGFNGTVIALNGGEILGDVALTGGTKNGHETVTVDPACKIYGEVYSYADDFEIKDVNGNEIKSEGEVAFSNETLADVISTKNSTVKLTEGVYEFPTIAEGSTIIGGEGVVFEDTLSGTLDDVTIKDVEIKDGNAQRWAYASGTLVFENCTFEATSVYAIHYDGTTGADIVYKNCTIIGWAAIGSGYNSLTFDGCTIKGNNTYGLIRAYGNNTTVKNCTFDVDNVNKTDVYQDGLHAVDCTINVIDCVNVNGSIYDILNTSGTGKINVIETGSTEEPKVAITNVDTLSAAIANGENVVLTKDVEIEANLLQNGGTLDGNGKTLDAYNATSNSDCAISTTGGTVENITIVGDEWATRALGAGSSGTYSLSEDLYVKNVTIDKVMYAINGGGAAGTNVIVTDSTVYGWISFSGIDNFKFTDCTIGKGNSYDGYMVVYGNTSFENCTFETFDMCASSDAPAGSVVEFKNCTNDGVKVTADNFKTLFMYPGDDVDFNKLSACTVIVDGVTVTW